MLRSNPFSLPVLLLAGVATAFVAPAGSLTFHAEAKSKLTKTFESKLRIASESMGITVDGNSINAGEGPKVQITDDETIQVTDEYLSVEDGRPTKLVRKFAELAGHSIQTVTMPEESGAPNQEEQADKESPLEGKTVVFTWKDDAYSAAWADEEKGGDDDLLEKLDGDMDLIGFLPSKTVSGGDTWVLEAKLFNRITSPGGRLELRKKNEDPSEADMKIDAEIEKNIEGEGKATYKGSREVDGVEVGVIEITAELESHGTVEAGERGNTFEYKVTYTGELLWDLEAGHLRSLELDGELAVSMDMKNEVEFNGESHEMHQIVEFAGTTEHRVTVE